MAVHIADSSGFDACAPISYIRFRFLLAAGGSPGRLSKQGPLSFSAATDMGALLCHLAESTAEKAKARSFSPSVLGGDDAMRLRMNQRHASLQG